LVRPPVRARHVDLGEIHRRVSRHDPLGRGHAGPRAVDDALRVEPRRNEQPGDLGHVSEVEVRIGREALGRPQVVREADRPDLGDPLARPREHGSEVIPVGPELHEAVGGDLIGGLGLAVRFERADQVSAPVVPDVEVGVEIAQERRVRSGALRLVGHHPHVLGGIQGDAGSRQPRELARPQAGGEHNGLRLDRSARRVESRDPTPLEPEAGDLGLGHVPRPSLGRAPHERESGVAGVHRAVGGEQHRADQVVDHGAGPEVLHRGGLEDLDVDADVSRHRDGVEALLHARRGACHRDGADPPKAGLDAGLGRQPFVRLRVDPRQSGQGMRAADLRHEARGVPRRAVREQAPLDHGHVGLAFAGEVVGDRRSDDAAAHDHDAGPLRELRGRHERREIDVAVGQMLGDRHARNPTPRRLRTTPGRPMHQPCEGSCSSEHGWRSGR